MVKSLLSILTVRQTTILSGATVIMATIMLSKVLGLIRNRLLVHYFPPQSAEVFVASLQLPDLIFQLLILGALSVAFIPVFTEYIEKKGQKEAYEMATAALNCALLIFGVVSIVIFIFADPILKVMFPGFSDDKRELVVNLTRITIFGQIALVVGSFFIGILQSFQRFIIPALAGVFYNIGIIAGLIFLSEPFGLSGPAIGVVIGALLHVGIQYPAIRSLGFKFNFNLKLNHPGVKEVVGLMSMRMIGLAAEQVNEKVGLALASLLSSGSLLYLTFAQALQIVPVSLFGTTLAQAALPVLSLERARGRLEEFKVTLLTTLHQILFLSLPAAAILIVLRIPAVRLVFGASQFDWEATVLTGKTVGFLAVGLAAQAVSLLLVRGFYALKDTKTPVVVSLITVGLNIVLSFYFVRVLSLDVWSLGLAFSVSAITSAILLFITLNQKVGGFDTKSVVGPLYKMLMSAIIMGMALYIPIKLLDQVIFDTTKTINLIILTGLSSIFALGVYIILVWYLKVKELVTFINLTKNLLSKMSKARSEVKSEEIIHDTDPV